MAFKNWNWRKIRKNLIKKGRTERAVDKAIEDIRLSSDLEYCQYQIRTAAEYRALNNPKRNEIILERWNSGEIRWRYLGNSYELNVEFDRFHEAQTRDMFCLEVQEEKIYICFMTAWGISYLLTNTAMRQCFLMNVTRNDIIHGHKINCLS